MFEDEEAIVMAARRWVVSRMGDWRQQAYADEQLCTAVRTFERGRKLRSPQPWPAEQRQGK